MKRGGKVRAGHDRLPIMKHVWCMNVNLIMSKTQQHELPLLVLISSLFGVSDVTALRNWNSWRRLIFKRIKGNCFLSHSTAQHTIFLHMCIYYIYLFIYPCTLPWLIISWNTVLVAWLPGSSIVNYSACSSLTSASMIHYTTSSPTSFLFLYSSTFSKVSLSLYWKD